MSPYRTLEGLFELTRRPSRALDRVMLLELQIYIDTGQVCRARRRGPRTLPGTTDTNFVFVVPLVEGGVGGARPPWN